MQAFGRTRVTSTEYASQLQFRISHESGWADLVIGPTISLAFVTWAAIERQWGFAGLCLFGSVAYLIQKPTPSVTLISVSATELVAETSSPHTKATVFPAQTIGRLEFSPGNDDDFFGMILHLRDGQTLRIVALERSEVEQILLAIRSKFPLLEHGDTSLVSLLHGNESGVITLNLS